MSEWEQQPMKQKQKQKVRQREKSEKKRTQLLWEYEWSLHVNFRHLLAKLESERRWTNARKLIESKTTNSNHHKRRMSEKVPEIKNAWAHLRLLLLFRLLFCGRQCAFALFCTCLGASTSISVWSCLCPRFHWNELIVVSTYSSYAPACAFPHAIFFIFIYFAININSAKKTTPIVVCTCVCLPLLQRNQRIIAMSTWLPTGYSACSLHNLYQFSLFRVCMETQCVWKANGPKCVHIRSEWNRGRYMLSWNILCSPWYPIILIFPKWPHDRTEHKLQTILIASICH